MSRGHLITLLVLSVATLCPALMTAAPPAFEVTFDRSVRSEPFTGRVYVFFSKKEQEPRRGPDWFTPEPFIAREVTDWKPGSTLVLHPDDRKILSYPMPISDLDLAGYRAQAVSRFNPWEREVGTGPGNGYGSPIEVSASAEKVRIRIDQLVKARPYEATMWGKLLEVRSQLLSDFYGREVSLRATVILPSSYYEEPQRRYPAIFTIPGFGGDHRIDPVREPVPEENERGVEFIRVMLDPSSPLGHHVFANSANNGPVGDAFVKEFLPVFEREFRSVAAPSARFLTGHSSGGWSSLWLQVAYPESFGGVWSTAPDPVDFQDFQRINIYSPGENMYIDQQGEERPLGRLNGQAVLFYRNFDRMEQVLGPGGQLHSFEAVFGPRGEDGRPVPLWDRETGEIDQEVASLWQQYDIRDVLEKHWADLGPKLAGKIHVIMGDADTFYLEGATVRLKKALEALGSDAVVEIVPGRTHFDLLTPELRSRIRREMTSTFLKQHEWK